MASNIEDPRFRRMLTEVAWELTAKEVKALSFTYLGYTIENSTDLVCALYNQKVIKDCTEDLNSLMKSLGGIKRTDLKEMVMTYIKSSQPNQYAANDHVSSTHLGTEESNGDMKKSTILGGIEYVQSEIISGGRGF